MHDSTATQQANDNDSRSVEAFRITTILLILFSVGLLALAYVTASRCIGLQLATLNEHFIGRYDRAYEIVVLGALHRKQLTDGAVSPAVVGCESVGSDASANIEAHGNARLDNSEQSVVAVNEVAFRVEDDTHAIQQPAALLHRVGIAVYCWLTDWAIALTRLEVLLCLRRSDVFCNVIHVTLILIVK